MEKEQLVSICFAGWFREDAFEELVAVPCGLSFVGLKLDSDENRS